MVGLQKYNKYSVCAQAQRQKFAQRRKIQKQLETDKDIVLSEPNFLQRNNKKIKIATKLESLLCIK